jgi:hypothetical protein
MLNLLFTHCLNRFSYTLSEKIIALHDRQLLNVDTKSTCNCYALDKNYWNGSPDTLICEFEDIILHDLKLYVENTECSIHMLGSVSQWNKQNRLKLKERTDTSTIPINKIIIQAVLQGGFMGAMGKNC